MQIELVPGTKNPNIKLKIEGLLINCVAFQASVAFWTVDVRFFGLGALTKALKKENSFICADIQSPTNIDNLHEFYKQGVREIYLHKYRQSPTEYTLNTNLLHSKIYLFLMAEDKAVIIIGSHNLTSYAIEGRNLEASIIIYCTISDRMYKDTLEYLQYVRDQYCMKFDVEKVDIYKKLQSRNAERTDEDFDLKKVVTLIGENMERLDQEEIVLLLSLNQAEHSKFRTTGDELHLHTFDLKTRISSLYKCKVVQTGELDKDVEKLEIDFTEPRRYAYIGTKKLSLLYEETKITKPVLEVSKYFVNISISYKIENFQVFEKPSGDKFSYWQSALDSPYHRKASSDEKKGLKIQIADTNGKPDLNRIELGKDYFKIDRDLSEFYAKLDELIKTEYSLTRKINISKANELLSKFLETTNKDIDLPQYSKSLIERIITEFYK